MGEEARAQAKWAGSAYRNSPQRNVQRFRGGLEFKAHRLMYHSTLGMGVIKMKKKTGPRVVETGAA